MPKLVENGPLVVENELFNFLKSLTVHFLLGEVLLKAIPTVVSETRLSNSQRDLTQIFGGSRYGGRGLLAAAGSPTVRLVSERGI